MFIKSLNHVNIRTANLQQLSRFYAEVLGLKEGDRPKFNNAGKWHYCGDTPVVHLVEVDTPPKTKEPRLEHFAFLAEGLADFLAHLRAHNVAYWISIVPGSGTKQVNLHDADGNHIEVQFAASEEADIGAFHGA